MKKFSVQVTATVLCEYAQEIEVEAEDQDGAEEEALLHLDSNIDSLVSDPNWELVDGAAEFEATDVELIEPFDPTEKPAGDTEARPPSEALKTIASDLAETLARLRTYSPTV